MKHLEKRPNQEQRLLTYFINHPNEWISVWYIVTKLRILQYGPRIRAIRKSGFIIENKTEMKKNIFGERVKHGYYKIAL